MTGRKNADGHANDPGDQETGSIPLKRFRGAITGGTGAYRGANGTFQLAFCKPSLTLRIIN